METVYLGCNIVSKIHLSNILITMKISAKAIEAFKGNSRLKNRIALEMNKSVYSVDRWISENEQNGPLTTARALQLISEETGLSSEEILEESTERIAS